MNTRQKLPTIPPSHDCSIITVPHESMPCAAQLDQVRSSPRQHLFSFTLIAFNIWLLIRKNIMSVRNARGSFWTVSAVVFLTIIAAASGCNKKIIYGAGFPENFSSAQLFTHNQMAYAKPNDDLKQMQKLTGYWTWEQIFWPFPGSESIKLNGICASKWILGKRYVNFDFKYINENADTEHGYIFIGHDQMLDNYSFYEIFSTLTSPIIGTGEWDEKKQLFTWLIEFSNPLNRKKTTLKRTIKINENGNLTWNIWRLDINSKLVRYQQTTLKSVSEDEMKKAFNSGSSNAVEPMPDVPKPTPTPVDGNGPG